MNKCTNIFWEPKDSPPLLQEEGRLSKAELVSVGTIDIVGLVCFRGGAMQQHYWTFSSICGSYSWDASSKYPSKSLQPKMTLDITSVMGAGKGSRIALLGTTTLKEMESPTIHHPEKNQPWESNEMKGQLFPCSAPQKVDWSLFP